ncbi:DUF2165 family protein [Utexia brackfieldae]|uniref:DUF2165 family protein n=1 Tax=Utexia brackfieldae TaxID=3074108 RepID=UPI00370D0835
MAMAFFMSLVIFSNITDYETNFQFVYHMFQMDTINPNSPIKYRYVSSPSIQHGGFILVIILQAITCVLCWLGSFILLKNIKAPAPVFNKKKSIAITGLTLGFLVWQVGFMSIAGGWYGVWMSSKWDVIPDSFRFFVTIILVLIYLVMPEFDHYDADEDDE